jgi:hypothetical protein
MRKPEMPAGRSLDTPERIAGLENQLEQRTFAIEDRKVL